MLALGCGLCVSCDVEQQPIAPTSAPSARLDIHALATPTQPAPTETPPIASPFPTERSEVAAGSESASPSQTAPATPAAVVAAATQSTAITSANSAPSQLDAVSVAIIPDEQQAQVIGIIDGDTIEVEIDGQTYRVRYIGIDTPERNEPCGDESTYANTLLVSGKSVVLRRDVSEADRYGRLLRYVYVNNVFVNAALVGNGWAESVHYPPDTAFAALFDDLHAQARVANIGCHPFGVFHDAAVVLPSPTAAPSVNHVTVTANSNVNLRSGPGTDYAVLGTLGAGQTVDVVGRNGDWLVLKNGWWVASWVVTVTGNASALPIKEYVPAAAPQQAQRPAQPQQAQPKAPSQPQAPRSLPTSTAASPPRAAPGFACDCGKTCPAMVSCEEAYFQLNQCGCTARDGDSDGVPCEIICPGG